MNEVVVRAPQTDRLRIQIPETLGDLTDYPASQVFGFAAHVLSTPTVEGGATTGLSADTYGTTEARQTESDGAGGLRVLVGGLYLAILTVAVDSSIAGPHRRIIGLHKNGSVAASYPLGTPAEFSTATQFTTPQRLVPGDVLMPYIQNLEANNLTVTFSDLLLLKIFA